MASAIDPLQSMTGFGVADGTLPDGGGFTWTLRSVNGKGLDIKLRLPAVAEPLEPGLREQIAKAMSRGSVSATLNMRDTSDDVPELSLNTDVLDAVLAAAKAISERTGSPMPGTDTLLGVRGVLETRQPDADPERLKQKQEALAATFSEALAALASSRRAEGAALGGIIAAQLDAIEADTAEAGQLPSRTPEAVRERLKASIAALIDAEPALDPERLHQEAILLAAKSDIQEELDRLKAHVSAARALLAKGGPIGRDLNFLAQEFNREANTICSKSGDVALTRIGLRLKSSIDQLREQVQNVA